MFFFFNDTATTEIYTLSLHDALPICEGVPAEGSAAVDEPEAAADDGAEAGVVEVEPGRPRERATVSKRPPRVRDRKSTRLNSSHANISYAVFCLKKKKHHPCRVRHGR